MSETALPPSLPQEIYELFIDTLGDAAKDDRRSRRALLQCSHVCRTFWIRARRHIFSDIRISERVGIHRTSVLQQLTNLLEMMTLSGPRSTASLIRTFSMNTMYEPQDVALINNPLFTTVLQEFIEARVLCCLELQTNRIGWPTIDPNTQQLLYDLCRTPHFKSLSIIRFDSIPPEFFDGANIRHLSLTILAPWEAISTPPQLDSLEVDALIQPPSDTTIGLPFSHLTKLTSTIREPRNLEATYALARMSSNSLQTLYLFFGLHVIVAGQGFDLKQLPKLRHLKLGVAIWNTMSPIKDLCQFISSAVALDSLTIEVKMQQDVRSPLKSIEKDDWRALDKTAVKSGVRRVHLVIDVEIVGIFFASRFVESAFVQDMKDLIMPLFSRLQMKDGIEFSIDVLVNFVGTRFILGA